MRKLFFFLIATCVYVNLLAQEEQPVRINELFNFGWKFHLGDTPDAVNASFNDADWRALDLPHDFQIEQPWVQSAGGARGFKEMGVGWYRKTFKANPSWKGKRVLLDVEGIMLTGDVWLNGEKVGGTDYGYLGFEADISKRLKYDGDNVMAVRASTGEKNNSRWYTGGGLFRDIHIIAKDSIAIAQHGVFITTKEIGADKATVNIQTEIEGSRFKEGELRIVARIFSPTGSEIAMVKLDAPKRAKTITHELQLPSATILSPELWSCEKPNLYTARIAVYVKGRLVDEVTEKFGIRTIEFSKEFGFKLNGQKVFLKGIANHHDLGAVGAAAYETAMSRQMDVLKSFGYNHIRTSHNPYSEAFLRLADEKGILVVDELYDKWSNKDYWAGRVPWTNLWYKNLPDWIKRDRNHPSVIMWSFGNELQMREDLAGYQTGDWGVTTYRMMNVLAKRYDSTRKTTVAMFPARAGGIGKNDPEFNVNIVPPELATVTDVASFNYRYYNYQDYLKHAPDMIMYQSEATTNELAAPFWGMDREKMVGLAYWGAIEYWGESNGWPKKGWNFSFFNHSLEPFPQAYLIKSLYVDTPMVHIAVLDSTGEKLEWNDITVGGKMISSHWNREKGKLYTVYTYTNAAEVELFVNGKSIGVQQNNTEIDKRNIITWKDVPYADGKIVAVAKDVNHKVIAKHELVTTGKAVALKIVTENAGWKADGMDLQYVKVYAIDSKGRVVPGYTGDAIFEVSGNAKLIAVDNGNHLSDELFAGNQRKMHKGFVMAILRSNQTAGEVKMKVSVTGLKSAERKMKTN